MTKTLIDIPQNILSHLATGAKAHGKSRSQLIREILSSWLQEQNAQPKLHDAAFGILKNHKIDGIKLQHKLRKEW